MPDNDFQCTEGLTLTESTTQEVTGALNISVSDSLAFTEDITRQTGELSRSVSDNLAFTEATPSAYIHLEILDIQDHKDIYLFTGTASQAWMRIEDPKDVFAFNGLIEELGRLAIIEPLELVSIQGRPEVLARMYLQEPLDEVLINGLTGEIGSLAIEDPLDVFSFAGVYVAHGIMALVDPIDMISLHGIGIPITFIRKGVVMNLSNYAVSEYKNYNFNSIVYYNGMLLGINDLGVHILDGDKDLDQQVEARIASGTEDLGKNVITIPREAWLAYRSDFGVKLDMRMDEVEDLPTAYFGKMARAIRECRAKLDRGIKARFFTWDLKNMSGSKFTLESLRVLGDVIGRKKR